MLRAKVVELVLREGPVTVDEISKELNIDSESVLKIVRKILYLELENGKVSARMSINGYMELTGTRPVLITAPHAQGPGADVFTGEIAWKVAQVTGAHALVATVSRRAKLEDGNPADYNREWARDTPFRRRIDELIRRYGIRFIVDVHGMESDPVRPDVDLGALGGRSAKGKLVSKIVKRLEEAGFDVGFEQEFQGGDILEYHCDGERVQGVQLELSEELRELGEYRALQAVLVVVNTVLEEV
ncbi:N-formylglutamate amidohydrolase [Methanopyrus sp.]